MEAGYGVMEANLERWKQIWSDGSGTGAGWKRDLERWVGEWDMERWKWYLERDGSETAAMEANLERDRSESEAGYGVMEANLKQWKRIWSDGSGTGAGWKRGSGARWKRDLKRWKLDMERWKRIWSDGSEFEAGSEAIQVGYERWFFHRTK